VSRVLVIPDLHCPFANKDAGRFLLDVYTKMKCEEVVCIGDEMDYASLSRWPKDPEGMSASLEHLKGLEQLHKILIPFRKVRFVTSNHTVRPLKLAALSGIPSAFLKTYREFLQAPECWSWEDKIIIDNVMYFHGEPYTGAQAHIKAATDNRMSTVIGHVHSYAGIQYMKTGHRDEQIFGLNVGCLIDPEAYAFAYGKHNRGKPVIGCGAVIDGKIGHFIPMDGR